MNVPRKSAVCLPALEGESLRERRDGDPVSRHRVPTQVRHRSNACLALEEDASAGRQRPDMAGVQSIVKPVVVAAVDTIPTSDQQQG